MALTGPSHLPQQRYVPQTYYVYVPELKTKNRKRLYPTVTITNIAVSSASKMIWDFGIEPQR